MLFVRFCNGNLSRGILEIVSLLRATPSCTGFKMGALNVKSITFLARNIQNEMELVAAYNI